MAASVTRHDEQAIDVPQPVIAPAPVAPLSVAPLSTGAGLTPSGVISLQRSAGNAATTLHLNSTRPTGNTRGLAQGSEVHLAPGRRRPRARPRARARRAAAARADRRRGRPRGPGGRRGARGGGGQPGERPARRAAGIEQHYEANEHEGLGNTAGGDKITIVTKSGVRLTYGQVVALSGDFYRSPEALMNAPADELRKILGVMAHEKALVGANKGIMKGDDAATLNAEYEAATSGSDRAKHHDHSSFSDHDDHDHEDLDADEEHEDEEEVHGGHKPRRMTKYGPMVGDESVEDAGGPGPGAGQLPSATGSFLDLADENSSHFSPENIRLNFKPKHLLALDLAREAWEARNPGKKAPAVPTGPVNAAAAKQGEGGEAGAAPSARMHTTPTQEGAKETGADPTKPAVDPRQATPTHVSRELQGRGRPAGGAGAADLRLRRAFPDRRVRRRPRRQRRLRAQVRAGAGSPPTRRRSRPRWRAGTAAASPASPRRRA